VKKYRLDQVEISRAGQFLAGIMQGRYIYRGGVGFHKPGERIHTNDGPEGKDWHVHDDEEAFVVLQGKLEMEIDGKKHPLSTGDIVVVEPGEDHHPVIDKDDPSVLLWFHAGPERNGQQR
jgi:mannose-6-phosphate isomerase-like protein (cupin superfamily)